MSITNGLCVGQKIGPEMCESLGPRRGGRQKTSRCFSFSRSHFRFFFFFSLSGRVFSWSCGPRSRPRPSLQGAVRGKGPSREGRSGRRAVRAPRNEQAQTHVNRAPTRETSTHTNTQTQQHHNSTTTNTTTTQLSSTTFFHPNYPASNPNSKVRELNVNNMSVDPQM